MLYRRVRAALAAAFVLATAPVKAEVEEASGIEACATLHEKGAAVVLLLEERFGGAHMVYDGTDKTNEISVEFYPPDDRICSGIGTFSADCDLSFEYRCE